MFNIDSSLDKMTIKDLKDIASSIDFKLKSDTRASMMGALTAELDKRKRKLNKRWKQQLQVVLKWKLQDLKKLIYANQSEVKLGDEHKKAMVDCDISVKQLFELCIDVCAILRSHRQCITISYIFSFLP